MICLSKAKLHCVGTIKLYKGGFSRLAIAFKFALHSTLQKLIDCTYVIILGSLPLERERVMFH